MLRMLRMKIGESYRFKEDYKLEKSLGKESVYIRKGDIGIITKEGWLRMLTGEYRNKIILTEFSPEDVDTENIARFIYEKLNSELHLEEMLDDYDIDIENVIDYIQEVLESIF